MAASNELNCPACGAPIVPMEGRRNFFCPYCGKPVDLEVAELVRDAKARAKAALEEAESAREEMLAAQAEARLAAEQAERAREQTARLEAERKAMEARHEAERQQLAREQAEQRVAALEAERAAARSQKGQAAAQGQAAPQAEAPKRPSGVESDGTLRDRASGNGIFYVRMPEGWAVTNTSLRRTGSSSRPYVASAQMEGPGGSVANLALGNAGTRNSAGMKILMARYGGAIAHVDTINYADMPDPLLLADSQAQQVANSIGAGPLKLMTQLDPPNIELRRQESQAHFERIAQMSGGAIIKHPYVCEVIRTYACGRGNEMWRIASYVRVFAIKDGMGLDPAAGMTGGLGTVFGSLFGSSRNRPQEAAPTAPSQAAGAWCTEDFASYAKSGTIFWSVEALASFAAPADVFAEQFTSAFLPLAGTSMVHDDLFGLSARVVMEEAGAVQQATNATISQMNAQHRAAMEANRRVQQAYDSYNASWQRASDEHHRQFRESTNRQFDSFPGGSSPDYSEAIRGVNTYTTSDGREVEVSVRAEHVYENQAGDVYGTDSSFEPGGDWTELTPN